MGEEGDSRARPKLELLVDSGEKLMGRIVATKAETRAIGDDISGFPFLRFDGSTAWCDEVTSEMGTRGVVAGGKEQQTSRDVDIRWVCFLTFRLLRQLCGDEANPQSIFDFSRQNSKSDSASAKTADFPGAFAVPSRPAPLSKTWASLPLSLFLLSVRQSYRAPVSSHFVAGYSMRERPYLKPCTPLTKSFSKSLVSRTPVTTIQGFVEASTSCL